MFRRPTKEINAEFIAEEQHLDSIQRTVRDACASAGMSRKETSAVLLAIEEGATNIIRHAYLYEKGMLRLRIIIYPKMIVFSLFDTGRSFKPEGSGNLDLARLVESGRRGGLGFYMIQKIMDSVEYVSLSGINELRMTKHLGTEAAKGTPSLLRRMLSLRVKFSFFTFVIVALIVGGAFYFSNERTTREVYSHFDDTVEALAKTIAEQAGGYLINRRSDVEFDELVVSYKTSNAVLQRVVITDSTSVIMAHSDDIHNIRNTYEYPAFADPNVLDVPQRTQFRGEELNYLIVPIMSGDRRLGSVHVTYSSAPVYWQLTEARENILIVTGLLMLIGVIGIYLLSNYFVKPIVNITRRVRRFSSGDLESELPLEGAGEFFEISRALNEMMTRLRRDRQTAVERERMAKEIEVASQIQKTLLPRQLPELPGLKIEAFYRAASMIGGDLYDIFKIDETRCCLVVADVSGKGVPASLVMSMLRTVIKIHAPGSETARETLIRVDNYLSANIPAGMFITVLMGIYDIESQCLNFVSAGHNPLLLYKAATRRIVRLNPSGIPLGVPVTLQGSFGDALEEVEVQLEPGDVFFLYTDGITEAVDREGRQYGVDHLADFLQSTFNGAEPPTKLKTLSDAIVNELDGFAGFANQRDDVTFVLGRTEALVEADDPDDSGSVDTRSLSDSPSETD